MKKMAGSTCAGIAPSPFEQLPADGQTIARLGGDVDSATTLSADTSYLLTSQLFIYNSAYPKTTKHVAKGKKQKVSTSISRIKHSDMSTLIKHQQKSSSSI